MPYGHFSFPTYETSYGRIAGDYEFQCPMGIFYFPTGGNLITTKTEIWFQCPTGIFIFPQVCRSPIRTHRIARCVSMPYGHFYFPTMLPNPSSFLTDQETEAGEDDIATIAPETPHKFKNIANGRLEIFCVHASPMIIQEELEG